MPGPTSHPQGSVRVVAIGGLIALVASLAPVAAPAVSAAPASPVIVGPSGGTTSSNPTFEWQPVPGAVSYLVWIDTPHSTGNLPFPTVNTMLTDVLFQQSTHVDWAVAAVDSVGAQGARSEGSFDVGPLTPTLTAPADGAAFTFPAESPFLSWRPAFDAGGATYYIDGRTGESSSPDLAGFGLYRADLSGAPGSFRWTAGQVLAPPPGIAPVRTFTVTWPDSVPTLVAPADGAEADTAGSVLSWSRVDGASGYDLQLDDGADFLSPISISDVRAILAPVSRLPAGTWHWRVRAREPHGGSGAWSAVRTLVVPEIATPSVLGPPDAADLTDYPLLRWEPVAGADGYQLQVTPSAEDAYIATRTVDATVFAAEPPGWETYAPIPFGPGPQTLTWRVRATFPSGGYAHGGTSAWSAWRTFTVDPPTGGAHGAPSSPTLVAPASCQDLATCATHPWSPVLDWDPVDGAAFYRVFFQHGGDGTGPATFSFDTAGSTFFDRFISGTDSVVGWDVLACSSVAACPTTLDTLRRRYRIETPSPAIIGPADGTLGVDPDVIVSWIPAAVEPAVPTSPIIAYQVGLQRMTNGEWSPWPDGQASGTHTAYAITDIHVGDSWKWRLRAIPGQGPASAWSAWRAVDRPPLLPAISGPADGATTDSTPRLSWDVEASIALGYHVDIVRGTPASGRDWAGLPRWGFDVTGRTLDVQPDLAPGDYTWRVSAGDPGGLADLAPLSSVGHFTVESVAPPVLLAPVAGASVPDDRGVFTWQPVEGAATYRVDLATNADFAPEHLIDGGSAWGTRFAARLRLPAGTVYWRVTAYTPGSNVIGSTLSDVTIGVSEPRLAFAVATVVDTTATLSAPATPTNAATLSYALAFSSPVTGLAAADLSRTGTATGCAVGPPAGTGTAWAVTVGGCTEGTVGLVLRAGTVSGPGGTAAPAADAVAATVTIDRTPPTAVLTAPASPTGTGSLTYSLAFGEPVTGLVAAAFTRTGTATGCTVGTPAGTGTAWTVPVSGCSAGTVGLALQAGTVSDAAGNVGPAAPAVAATVTVTAVGPSADLACTPDAGPTSATAIACVVNFGAAPGNGSTFTRAGILLGGTAKGWSASDPAGTGAGTYAFTVSGTGSGTLTIAVASGAVTDDTGGPSSASGTVALVIDRTAPTATAPGARLPAGSAIGSTVPVKVTWSAADTGSGIDHYELAFSANGGRTYTSIVSPTTAADTRSLKPSSTNAYRFRVRAVDHAGNPSAWMAGPVFHVRLLQETSSALRWSGAWTRTASSSALGGRYRATSTRGRAVSYAFTGRAVAFAGLKAKTMGSVKVYLDGTYVGKASEYATSSAWRRLVWSRTWTKAGKHTLRLVCAGTSGHPRVNLDAIVVLW